MAKQYTYLFFGGPEIAARALEQCVNDLGQPQAIITTPDRPSGRGQQLRASAVATLAATLCPEIPIYKPKKITSVEIDLWAKYSTEVLIVVAYPRILGPKTRALAVKGAINFHPSLLPKYRGPDPIRAALFNLDKKTGVSVMLLDDGVDTGPLIGQKDLDIDINDNYQTLTDKICDAGLPFFTQTIQAYLNTDSQVRPQKQQDIPSEMRLSQTVKINSEIEILQPENQTALKMLGIIRALAPKPGAKIMFQAQPIKILAATFSTQTNSNLLPGLHIVSEQALLIGSDNQALILNQIQKPGGNPMPSEAWINGLKSNLV